MAALITIALKALAVLGPLGPMLQKFFSLGSGIVVAIITSIPPFIDATGRFLDYVSKNALAAFLLGGFMFGSGAFLYGLSWDAPLRERAQQHAIDNANRRAELAIANATREAMVRVASAERERDAAKAALAKATKKR